MKLFLSVAEVQEAIAAHVNAKMAGHNVKPEDVTASTHVEGDYEEQRDIFDGLYVDLH